MGEPVTKVILELENIVAERLALGDTYPENHPWRCFAAAGDDLLALGPEDYLQRILHYHRLMGVVIGSKALLSQKVGRLCEKLVFLKGNFLIDPIKHLPEDREAMAMVDTIKLRLLSQTTKGRDVEDDRNPALGKGLQLCKTLRWLDKVLGISENNLYIRMIYDRFCHRMHPFLPALERTDANTLQVWRHLRLPKGLGGAGLWYSKDHLKEVLFDAMEHSLTLHGILCYVAFPSRRPDLQPEINQLNAALSGFASNIGFRGMRLPEGAKFLFEEIYWALDPVDINVAYDSLPDTAKPICRGFVRFIDRLRALRKNGWLISTDLDKVISRGVYFQSLLEGNFEQARFNTTPWLSRLDALYRKFDALSAILFAPLVHRRPDISGAPIPGIVWHSEVEIVDTLTKYEDPDLIRIIKALSPQSKIGWSGPGEEELFLPTCEEEEALLLEFAPPSHQLVPFAQWAATGLCSLRCPLKGDTGVIFASKEL